MTIIPGTHINNTDLGEDELSLFYGTSWSLVALNSAPRPLL
jgi:hypothetical protein